MYYKGTHKECLAYDKKVTAAKKYQGVTKNWANPIEIEGSWYILKHDDYESEMDLVSELPIMEKDTI
jgi:hypothetical protein